MPEEIVTLTINGKEITAKKGATILNTALKHGIDIPHFCYHRNLSIAGNCRMCLVEVEGWPKLVISCATTVSDGMAVHTNNEKVRIAVKSVLEFILLNHPIDCPICDQSGECWLQDYYMEYGLHNSRIPLANKVRKRKVVDLGPKIVLDTERCILCSRCIRFCNEISKTNELTFVRRGVHSEITTFENRPLDNPYSLNTVDICPVGALTSRDFRFKCRVWFLNTVDSICDHCSTGCNIHAEQHKNRIYRFRPRENAGVNKSWMCDEGRLSYKKIYSRERLESPMIRKNNRLYDVQWYEALQHVHNVIQKTVSEHGPDAVGVIASPKLSTEELYLVKELFSNSINTPHIDFRIDDDYKKYDEMEDELLKRADKNPNTRGAMMLKLVPGTRGANVPEMIEKIEKNELKTLLLITDDILETDTTSRIKSILSTIDHLVLVTPYVSDLQKYCEAALPLSVHLEKDGTFVNANGRIQKFRQCVKPAGAASSLVEIINELLVLRGFSEELSTHEKVFAKMSTTVSALDGIKFAEIPPDGIQLKLEEE